MLRCDLPPESALQGLGSAWEVTGGHEALLTSAVRHGVFLKVDQLKSIIRSLGLEEMKVGSGRGKGVLKADLVQHLLRALFPDAGPGSADYKKMFEAMMNQKCETISPGEEQGVTHMISCLDTENAEEFKLLAKHAKEKIDEHVRRIGRETARNEFEKAAKQQMEEAKEKFDKKIQKLEEERQVAVRPAPAHRERADGGEPRRVGVTPRSFKNLLQCDGEVHFMCGKHDRSKKFVSVVYPGALHFINARGLLFFSRLGQRNYLC